MYDWIKQSYLDVIAPIFRNSEVELIWIPYLCLALYMVYKPYQEQRLPELQLKNLRLGAEVLFIGLYNSIIMLGKLSVRYNDWLAGRLIGDSEPNFRLVLYAVGSLISIVFALALLAPLERYARSVDRNLPDTGTVEIGIPNTNFQTRRVPKVWLLNVIACGQTLIAMAVTIATYRICKSILES